MDYLELKHYGIKGQKWGHRNYENYDGTLTPEGKARYYDSEGHLTKRGAKAMYKAYTNRANRAEFASRNKDMQEYERQAKIGGRRYREDSKYMLGGPYMKAMSALKKEMEGQWGKGSYDSMCAYMSGKKQAKYTVAKIMSSVASVSATAIMADRLFNGGRGTMYVGNKVVEGLNAGIHTINRMRGFY